MDQLYANLNKITLFLIILTFIYMLHQSQIIKKKRIVINLVIINGIGIKLNIFKITI